MRGRRIGGGEGMVIQQVDGVQMDGRIGWNGGWVMAGG